MRGKTIPKPENSASIRRPRNSYDAADGATPSQSSFINTDPLTVLPQSLGNWAIQQMFIGGGPQIETDQDLPIDRRQTAVDPSPETGPPATEIYSQKSAPESHALPAARLQKRTRQALRTGGLPLPERMRWYYQTRHHRDFSMVRIHTGSDAADATSAANARALTLGNTIAFAPGRFNPLDSEGRRLLAHELTHVDQDRTAQTLYRWIDEPDVSREELTRRDTSISQFLQSNVSSELCYWIVEQSAGLAQLERDLPATYAIVRERMIADVGEEIFSEVRENDQSFMYLVSNAAEIEQRLSDLSQQYLDDERYEAYEFIEGFRADFDLNYAHFVRAYAQQGSSSFLIYYRMVSDPNAQIEDLEREAEAAQTEWDQYVNAGRTQIGQTIAVREAMIFADDELTLTEVLRPVEGTTSMARARIWARTAGRACAIIEVEHRYFVYGLSENYDIEDALTASFLERRTEIVARPHSGLQPTIVTADGVVLNTFMQRIGRGVYEQSSRYFVNQEAWGTQESIRAGEEIASGQSEALSNRRNFLLFRELTRDLALRNLNLSEARLRRERNRLRGNDITGPPDQQAATQLQQDTAALRRHMVQAAIQIDTLDDPPSQQQIEALRQVLADIGRIHKRTPVAAAMVIRNREPDGSRPVEEGDFENRIAGMRPSQAAWFAIADIDTRLENIQKIRTYLTQNEDAPLYLESLHPVVLRHFGDLDRTLIHLRIIGKTLGMMARAIGVRIAEIVLSVAGFFAGGIGGLIIAGAALTVGQGLGREFNEYVDTIEAASQMDLTGEYSLLTPEMAHFAQGWVWSGIGLLVLDAAGLLRGVWSFARMRMILESQELGGVMAYQRIRLREAADEMGIDEATLTERLSTATGSARRQLLNQVQEALTRVKSSRAGIAPPGTGPHVPTTSTPLTPDEMLDFILYQRGWVSAAPRDAEIRRVHQALERLAQERGLDLADVAQRRQAYALLQQEQPDLFVGNRLPGNEPLAPATLEARYRDLPGGERVPGPGTEVGVGYQTFSIGQLIDREGNVVATELGAFTSRNQPHLGVGPGQGAATVDIAADAHAEAQIVAQLEARIQQLEAQGVDLTGGRLQIMVDQLPCGPNRQDCSGLLRSFATQHGFELDIFVPTREALRGGGAVSPKTAARGWTRYGRGSVNVRAVE